MSTIEHEQDMVAELTLRVAAARSPLLLSLLWTEIESSSLSPDQKGTLQDLIVLQTSNGGAVPASGHAQASQPTTVDTSASRAAVGTFTLAAFHEQITRASRVTDISWLINELPNVDCSAAHRVEAMRRLMVKREELLTGTAAPCE